MHRANTELENDNRNVLPAVGFISAFSLAFVSVITLVMAVFTPPISGPFSAGPSILYPYADIMARFPRDYYWMYPAMLLMLIYVVYMVCIDQHTDSHRKIFSRIALNLACISAGIVFTDYFIQVSVIQPSLLNGELDAIAILTQYNPHGIFIALEEAGYLIMAISILFLAPVFTGPGRLPTALRWIAILSFALTLLSLIVISFVYGVGREYRFEVAIITIDFTALILLGILSGILFRRQ